MRAGLDMRWIAVFVLYFPLQALSRRYLGGASLNWDEAEAFFFARDLAWGYGPQPPLYFWMQWGVFQALGETVLALTAFKNLLLFGIMTLLYAFLRREVEPNQAGAATLSLGLIGPLVWEAQRALTHTALAMLMAVVALWLAVRALERGRWGDYLLLGLAVGLGALSKLNFLVWAGALLLAAVALPEWRGRVRPERVATATGVAALLNLPVVIWMFANPAISTAGIRKLDFGTLTGWEARLAGSGELAFALLNCFVLAVLVLGGFWWGSRRNAAGPGLPPGVKLYGMASALTVGLLWAMILITGSTEIDHIWLLPLASGLVPVAVVALWSRLADRARSGLIGTAGALWLVVLFGLPLSGLLSPSTSNRGLDFGPLAARLEELQVEGREVALTNVHTAGNLVLARPALRLRLVGIGAPELPRGAAAVVTRPDDPLRGTPTMRARIEGVESFQLVPGLESRRQVITLLAGE